MEFWCRASFLVFLICVLQIDARARGEKIALPLTTTTSSSTSPWPTQQAFVHHDCGSSPSRRVRFVNVTLSPSPIRAPGRVRLSTVVDVTETLPMTLSADVIVSKYFYGIPLKVPCYNNFGTCHHRDVCSLLASVFPTDDDCPRVLKRHGIPCRCPFGAGVYNLRRWLFNLPALSGVLESLATGEYDVRLRLYDSSDKSELACLQVKFNMKRQRKRKPTMMTTTTKRMTRTTTTTSSSSSLSSSSSPPSSSVNDV